MQIAPKNRRAAALAPRFVLHSTSDPEMMTANEEEKKLYESLLAENVKLMNDIPRRQPNDWWFQIKYLLDPRNLAACACIGLWGFLTFKTVGVP